MRWIMFVALPLIILAPVAIYMYHFLKRSLSFWKMDFGKKSRKRFLVVISILISLLAANIWGLPALVILHIIVFSLCLDLIHQIVKKASHDKEFWLTKVYLCGLAPILLGLAVVGYGYFNMHHVIETPYTIETNKSLSKDYKVAMISDLHFETTMDLDTLQDYCDEIGSQKPDLVLLCGDIVDENTSMQGMMSAMKELAGINSTYGTFYVYGNHDKATYSSFPAFTPEELATQMNQVGIHVIEDSSYQVADDFTLVGRVDRSFGGEIPRLTTSELLNGVDKQDFILLADHQPVDLVENQEQGVDLQLSGHTHGGQIWPVGLISDVMGFGELNYGYKRQDNFQVIVSSGMAGWGYAVRTGHHSEYLMVTIKSK